jgi:hypothetical protein
MTIGPCDLTSPLASGAALDENRPAGSVEVALLKREYFAEPPSGAPEQEDQRSEPVRTSM